uniref:histidinol dehydrogenase n=1 Tax=Ningiella ruwaisensis TaxID=2364274 RepID=UPI003BAC2360
MIQWSSLTAAQKTQALTRPALSDSSLLQDTVKRIIQRVLDEKDEAILAYSKEFDGADLSSLRLPVEDIVSAQTQVSAEVRAAIDLAYSNIRSFHEAQFPQDIKLETQKGVLCEQKHAPLEKVGLYIPGGSAPLPSTVLMLGVCAQVAGCKLPILCTPPSRQAKVAPEILYAASKCGIEHVYLCGGAQAIAGMAFGTQSIPKVDKIFGPGNSFVTEAKQQVSQRVDGAAIDMPAGPSEVLVLADANANPAFVASDLLSQAEHGSDSQAVLVSNDKALIKATQQQVLHQLATLPRKDIASQSIANSRIILTDSMQEAVEVSNAYAAEHLIVQVDNARDLLPRLANAGSIFLGAYSPESAGDYASGTNHVLPTYGYARNYSSLGLLDFMRRYTVQELSEEGIKGIGPAIMALAQAEGLDAHKQAVALRLKALGVLKDNVESINE